MGRFAQQKPPSELKLFISAKWERSSALKASGSSSLIDLTKTSIASMSSQAPPPPKG